MYFIMYERMAGMKMAEYWKQLVLSWKRIYKFLQFVHWDGDATNLRTW